MQSTGHYTESNSNKGSISDGVKAMFSAIKQQETPVKEATSTNVVSSHDTTDGCGYEVSEVFIKEKNNSKQKDDSQKENLAPVAASITSHRTRLDQKSDSCPEVEDVTEKRKARRVVSESTMQNKVW